MTAATTGMSADRTLPWDWYAGTVPPNVQVSDQAYLETTFSFLKFRSGRPDAVEIGAGVSIYLGTMFDVGPHGRVSFGDYSLCNGARIVCDIGDHHRRLRADLVERGADGHLPRAGRSRSAAARS